MTATLTAARDALRRRPAAGRSLVRTAATTVAAMGLLAAPGCGCRTSNPTPSSAAIPVPVVLPFTCNLFSYASNSLPLLDVDGSFWQFTAADQARSDLFHACSGPGLTVDSSRNPTVLSLAYLGHHDIALVPAPQPASTPKSAPEAPGFSEPVPCANGYRFQVDFAGRIWEAAPSSVPSTDDGVQFDCRGGPKLVLIDATHALETTFLVATVALQRIPGQATSVSGAVPNDTRMPVTCASHAPLVIDALGSLWSPTTTPDLAAGATIACYSPASVELPDSHHLILHGLITDGTDTALTRRTAPVPPPPCA